MGGSPHRHDDRIRINGHGDGLSQEDDGCLVRWQSLPTTVRGPDVMPERPVDCKPRLVSLHPGSASIKAVVWTGFQCPHQSEHPECCSTSGRSRQSRRANGRIAPATCHAVMDTDCLFADDQAICNWPAARHARYMHGRETGELQPWPRASTPTRMSNGRLGMPIRSNYWTGELAVLYCTSGGTLLCSGG